MMINRRHRVGGLTQSYAGALIIPAVVFRQERPDNSMLSATSYNGTQRFVQPWHARCLPWPFSVSHLNERRHNQLRFTAAARGDCCTGFIRAVTDASTKLARNDRRNDTGAGLFQDGVSRFIQWPWLSLVLAATISGQERRQLSFNDTQCMTIPARAF